MLPAFALFALAGAPLRATSYVMVSDEALVDASPVAAVVRVDSVDHAAGRAAGKAVTEYVVRVEEVLKGTLPANSSVVVRVPGGLGPNGMALRIYGAPRFAEDERALLFLEPTGDGAYRVMHLLLGAFHEVREAGHQLAVRDLAEAREIRQTDAGVESVPGSDRPRDFDAFARWVAERAADPSRKAADYYVKDDGIGSVTGRYRLFEDPDDGFHLRWFNFDTGGSVQWKAYNKTQPGVSGGGYTQFQAALNDWNNEAETPIKYTYGGKTSAKNGLITYDEVNAILFNDPNNELPSFSCSSGGVLAYGGPWYFSETQTYRGDQYHGIANADVVINDGLSCFFTSSPNGSKAAEELFAHELGHTLGLNHPCGDTGSEDPNCTNPAFDDALMRAYIHDDGRGGRLANDDKIGLWVLYRPGFSVAPNPPTGLTATPVSTTEIRLNWNDNSDDETGFKVERRELTGSFTEILSLPANTTTVVVTGLAPATGYAFRVRAVNDGGASAYSNEAIASTNGPVGPCVADAHTLCLLGDRFRVQVAWETTDGATGQASVVPGASDNSGVLWFFNEDNWEMLLKVIDGCTVTNHYWVFFAATTNVEFVVTVTDTQTGAVKTYLNPQGNSADAVTDTNALACP
ncbi:MAG: fibronectin type III domain-containing protein [Acidobacteriota bacterium]